MRAEMRDQDQDKEREKCEKSVSLQEKCEKNTGETIACVLWGKQTALGSGSVNSEEKPSPLPL